MVFERLLSRFRSARDVRERQPIDYDDGDLCAAASCSTLNTVTNRRANLVRIGASRPPVIIEEETEEADVSLLHRSNYELQRAPSKAGWYPSRRRPQRWASGGHNEQLTRTMRNQSGRRSCRML